jgi:hypothetical protein
MQMGILEHGLTMAMTHPETEQVKQWVLMTLWWTECFFRGWALLGEIRPYLLKHLLLSRFSEWWGLCFSPSKFFQCPKSLFKPNISPLTIFSTCSLLSLTFNYFLTYFFWPTFSPTVLFIINSIILLIVIY